MMRHSSFIQRLLYIGFILSILLMSWEFEKENMTLAAGQIPEEAIRLRILANSDLPHDQWLKNKVRDAVVDFIDDWSNELEDTSLDTAKEEIANRLHEVESIVADVLKKNGSDYDFHVTLGLTQFPAKLYGSEVYPAGEYEALRITIGEGMGRNWWCVLFPPLCFVDLASGQAVPEQTVEAASEQHANDSDAEKSETEENETEVRFFLWDLLIKIKDWIVGLFK